LSDSRLLLSYQHYIIPAKKMFAHVRLFRDFYLLMTEHGLSSLPAT